MAAKKESMTKTKHQYNSYNPFIEQVITHIESAKRRKVSGWKWQEVRKGDELVNEPMLVLGDIKKVDTQEFYKVYIGEIKSFLGLSKNSMIMFEYIMKNIQYGKDKICMNAHIVKSEMGMAETTMHRCLNQLLDKQVVARAEMPGCYYINPQIAFKGERFTIVKQYVMDKMKRQNEIPSGKVNEPEPKYYTENKQDKEYEEAVNEMYKEPETQEV